MICWESLRALHWRLQQLLPPLLHSKVFVCECVCVPPWALATENTTDAKTKTSRFHKSFRKTSQVVTSIASLYLSAVGVRSHQIISLIFNRSAFIVTGCRFTCQTTCKHSARATFCPPLHPENSSASAKGQKSKQKMKNESRCGCHDLLFQRQNVFSSKSVGTVLASSEFLASDAHWIPFIQNRL